MYSSEVLRRFILPTGLGIIPDADGIGTIGDPACGDVFCAYIKVRDNHLAEVRFQIQGCPTAIASCSATAELAWGLRLEKALELTDEKVAAHLGGLPAEKLHCSNLAAQALHRAINDYLAKKQPMSGATG